MRVSVRALEMGSASGKATFGVKSGKTAHGNGPYTYPEGVVSPLTTPFTRAVPAAIEPYVH